MSPAEPDGPGRVDALATEIHYARHLAAVWAALPEDRRGLFCVAGALADVGPVPPAAAPLRVGYPSGRRPVLVAGHKDEQMVDGQVIYLEHGAGQTYGGDPGSAAATDPSYSGSPGHHRAILFLSPNETVAGRWRAAYPTVPAVAVGCPYLDGPMADPQTAPHPRVVALSFHSAIPICPESGTALPHYGPALPALVAVLRAGGYEVLGHGHPRVWPALARRWASLGVEPVADFSEVVARAGVYVCDNSSTLYEAAACGLGVVTLNAPWYRRNVVHGLRFWSDMPGVVISEPYELSAAIDLAWADPPQLADRRTRLAARVYAHRGSAAAQAAAAVLRVVSPIDAGERVAP